MKTVKQVASLLTRRGGQRINDVVVRSANVSEDGNYIILRLNQDVPMMVQKTQEDGTVAFERGVGNTLFVTPISVNAVLGNDPECATVKNLILDNDENVRELFSYATIDVIQEAVTEGDDYKSPWNDDAESHTVEHDTYYTHLLAIKPGDAGYDMLDLLKEAKREFQKEEALKSLKERFKSRARGTRSERISRAARRAILDDAEETVEETVEAEAEA